MESDCIHDQHELIVLFQAFIGRKSIGALKTKQFFIYNIYKYGYNQAPYLGHVLLLFQHKALFACAYHSLPVE